MKTTFHKFKFKGQPFIWNVPESLASACTEAGFTAQTPKQKDIENLLAFIHNKAEATQFLSKHLSAVKPDAVLWLAFPKGTSKLKSDINRDTLNALAGESGITAVTAISINEIWSALRFRPFDKVGT